MELGKGKWSDKPEDLKILLSLYLNHLKNYDRILILRCLKKSPKLLYELIEIPKNLLLLAKKGELEMKTDSKQSPKPGYCHVRNNNKDIIYCLYFDGGTERKLQIKNLLKNKCIVHAEWSFFIPE